MGKLGIIRILANRSSEIVLVLMRYDFKKSTSVEVKIGVSYVSIDNARENLLNETRELSFE